MMIKNTFPIVLSVLFATFISFHWFSDDEKIEKLVLYPVELHVEVTEINPTDFSPNLTSFGRVQARSQGALISQVKGEITYLSENFRNGGFFKEGELLVAIDPRDYEADVRVATAGFLSAKQSLLEEQARSNQAKSDWKRANGNKEASVLVLRQPQLATAKAKLYSAEAALDKAKFNLERTSIVAPYDGHTLTKKVAKGQVVSANGTLGEIFATDIFEIRLPLKNEDLQFIDFPQTQNKYAQSSQDEQNYNIVTHFPTVQIVSTLTANETWLGKLVRTESAIDASSQQLHVVVHIEDPYGNAKGDKRELKIGQYVNATFSGKAIEQAIIVSNSAIYQNSYVYLVLNGELKQQAVSIAWKNSEYSLISSGLSQGDLLITTPLGDVISGMPVKIHHKKQAVQLNTDIRLIGGLKQLMANINVQKTALKHTFSSSDNNEFSL